MSDYICYGELIEQSCRCCEKNIKKSVEEGLPSRHFYITFLTDHKDVEIDENKTKNPYDVTIVLQTNF